MTLTISRDPSDARRAPDFYRHDMSTIARKALDTETLMREIALYLAAVELFRREGYEPRWMR